VVSGDVTDSAQDASGIVVGRARGALSRGWGGGHPLIAVAGRRLMLSVPLLFVVSALVFVLASIIPGDVTETILGNKHIGHHPPLSEYAALRRELGLDLPLPLQYWRWVRLAFHGDLGSSYVTRVAVSDVILQRAPVTLSLTIGALVVSVVLGVGLGVVSAVRGGAVGRVVDVFAMAGWVLPVYWIAAELIVVLAAQLRWFPALGYVAFSQSPAQWARSLALPVVALAIGPIGGFAKFTREAMLDALQSEYVRVARGNGISAASIVLRHAFRTASVQVVTLTGLVMIGLLTGTVFAENVFVLPGLGSLIVSGVTGHDVPVVQGVTVFFTIIIIGINLATDLAYCLLNPRVRIT
jgi:peptide/nickel transport system permease protein